MASVVSAPWYGWNRRAAALPLLAFVLACQSGNSLPVNDPECELRSTQVVPASASIEVGQTFDFSGPIQQGGCNGVSYTRTWSTSNSAIATIDATGRATGVAIGGPVTVRLVVVAGTIPNQQVEATGALTVGPPTVATITLDVSALALVVGQNRQVVATARSAANVVVPSPAYSWQSTDPAVASVTQGGLVTAVAPGTATIRVTSNAVQATLSVTVTAVPAVPVASVPVPPPTPTVVAGGTVALAATTRDGAGNVLTGRTVAWSSSATTIAQVSTTGVVTAIAQGSATITATSEGQSGTAVVTVTPPPVGSVTVTPGVSDLFVTGTQQLTATPRDGNGAILPGETVTWSSSAPTIASVSGAGLVTAVAEGNATITATVRGVPGTAAVTVRVARMAYALIDQPSASSHTPALENQFNGLGGPLTVVRTDVGRYTVTVPGFGSVSEARLPFVTSVGGLNVACSTPSWALAAPGNGTVTVECRTAAGAFADSRFTLLVLGANALPGAHAFGSTLGMGAFPGPAMSSWSSGGTMTITRFNFTPIGRFVVEPGILQNGSIPRAYLVTAVGGPTPQCTVPSFGTTIDVYCQVGSTPTDAPFNAAMLQQGRPGLRFATGNNGATSGGSASASSLGSVATINSAGGSITTVRSSAGVYRMTLAGLGRAAGGRETVLLSTWYLLDGSRCVLADWQTQGGNLVVDVNCFSSAGAAADVGFQLVVIE